MATDHAKMVEALKCTVVPRLKKVGFKGTFPHFRRKGRDRIDLLSFQFDKWGGGFIIEISQCPPEGIITPLNESISGNNLKALDMHPDRRVRLCPDEGSAAANWFRYDDRVGLRAFKSIYEKTAESVLPYLAKAERWWSSQ